MLTDAAGHRAVVTVEDGWREGGAGSCVADRLVLSGREGPVPTIRVLGVPNQYIPKANPTRSSPTAASTPPASPPPPAKPSKLDELA